MTPADRFREIARQCASVAAHNDYPASRLAQLVGDLADVMVEALAPATPPAMEIGREYLVTLVVKATVVSADEEGSIELMLDRRNYTDDRVICVDADEIQSAR